MRQLAEEYAKLSAEQQSALTGDGLAWHKLPEAIQKVIQVLFENGAHSGAFILDPNAPVRVNITEIDGATHYTLTTKASFLANMRVKDV